MKIRPYRGGTDSFFVSKERQRRKERNGTFSFESSTMKGKETARDRRKESESGDERK